MFRKKYKDAMDNIQPDASSIKQTHDKMMGYATPVKYKKHRLAASFAVFVLAAILLPVLLIGAPNTTTPPSELSKLIKNNSYADIFAMLKTYDVQVGKNVDFVNESPESMPDREPNEQDNKDYSETNTQVKGVQESDIVKTDGNYIYSVGQQYSNNTDYYLYNEVAIIAVDGEQTELVSTISLGMSYDNVSLLLYGDILIIVSNSPTDSSIKEYYSRSNSSGQVLDMCYPYQSYETEIQIYNISDRANPELINTLSQDGSINTVRMIGSQLYTISSHYIYEMDAASPETFIPSITTNGVRDLIEPGYIYALCGAESKQYTIITSIDVEQPDNFNTTLALLGYTGTVYCSLDYIYLSTTIYDHSLYDESENLPTFVQIYSSEIAKIALNGGNLEIVASASIPGCLLNQFSMDEYDGYLRVATTNTYFELIELYMEKRYDSNDSTVSNKDSYKVYMKNHHTGEMYTDTFNYSTGHHYEEYIGEWPPFDNMEEHYDRNFGHESTQLLNQVYVLDENLNIVGSITDMAPGERIYSVRFDGEVGYVVTFEQIDPLFAIDLSNPTKPKVLSELKIPGFSTYLQKYGDNLLFGLGTDLSNIKLSMFDVSDKTNVTEQAVYIYESSFSYSEAQYNHKAILANSDKNIIGFPVGSYKGSENYLSYVFMKYEDQAFVLVKEVTLQLDYMFYQSIRGLFIGDYIYVCSGSQVIAINNA